MTLIFPTLEEWFKAKYPTLGTSEMLAKVPEYNDYKAAAAARYHEKEGK